jgi:hypothetical protein
VRAKVGMAELLDRRRKIFLNSDLPHTSAPSPLTILWSVGGWAVHAAILDNFRLSTLHCKARKNKVAPAKQSKGVGIAQGDKLCRV